MKYNRADTLEIDTKKWTIQAVTIEVGEIDRKDFLNLYDTIWRIIIVIVYGRSLCYQHNMYAIHISLRGSITFAIVSRCA